VGVNTAVALAAVPVASVFDESCESVFDSELVQPATTIAKAIATSAIFSSFEMRIKVTVMVMSGSNRPNSVLPAYQAIVVKVCGYSMLLR
jgi:hypothetical protein